MHYGIIAAGEGSRLAHEGVRLPKPLVEIEGQPMIGRLIGIFASCRAESINVIVNEQMKEVRDYLGTLAGKLPLNVVVKSTPSSMHSFAELSAIMPRHGKFILTTVDTIFRPEDFGAYVKAFEEADGIDAMMAVTAHIDDEKPLYVATGGDGMRVTAFLDAPRPDAAYVSGGIYGLTPAALGVLRRCLADGVERMRNFQRRLIADGLDVRAFDMGKILDIDHADDIAKANRFLARQRPAADGEAV